jgi:nitrate reductase alpha subunit
MRPEGKLDLLVTLDFRMSTTCVYSDIVLPTATWYEKNDLNTSDMHPFIHPLTGAVDPAWESRSDWEIYKGIAKAFSRVAPRCWASRRTWCSPDQARQRQRDRPALRAQTGSAASATRSPGKTMPAVTVVERDYPNTYQRFTALGPLMEQLGNGGKGIDLEHRDEVAHLAALNGVHARGPTRGWPGSKPTSTPPK